MKAPDQHEETQQCAKFDQTDISPACWTWK